MLKLIKNLDNFSKNIIVVLAGTSLVNIFNLLYQLLIAHRLSPADFAAFNSLISLITLVCGPLITLQAAAAKYTAEYSAHGQTGKITVLLSGILRKAMLLSLLTLLIFFVATNLIAEKLKISSLLPGYFTAILIATGWITPVVMGGLQGLELFGWITSISVFTGILKLGLAFNFVILGFNIGGALAAFLLSSLIGITLTILPLRKFISLKKLPGEAEDNNSCEVNFSEVFFYLFPVAISSLCFIGLVSMDMVLVKYYFGSGESGLYALAQMVGKIFLFLPGAISMVMFPHTSRLNAKQMDTSLALRRSILYAVLLCSIVVIGYNTFPTLILRILTGKVFTESIILGRLFSISMSFFALVFIFITYFLSLKDYRFIKYLAVSALLQFFAIVLFHNNLLQIQLILCLNSILLFLIHLFLHIRKA